MKRASVEVLGDEIFDVLVIGGGIYGLMAARDAALRGLRTALVERDDFGGATSHNSLKLMHGGIRYVQHLDFGRLRASAREQAFWQRAAPTLVHPIEFTIPLFGHGAKGPEAFAAAALIYRAATARIRGPEYRGARAIGVTAARRRLGGHAPANMTGGGIWRDGQLVDVNRAHMAALRASLDAGALAANYMAATALIASEGRIIGARLRDRLNGAEGVVHARVTLSCTGAGAAALAAPHLGGQTRLPGFARATNLVVDRQIGARGIGVVSRIRSDAVVDRGGRMYFLTPWAGRTIIGTHEAPADTGPRDDADVDAFLAEIAIACPALHLSRRDVLWVHQGLIPAGIDDARGVPKRQTRGTLIDHSGEGLGGLLSVVGVKYTTARLIAERAVDRAAAQLDHPVPPSRAFFEPLPVSDRVDPHISDRAGVQARIAEAFEHEMAATLEDVTIRRTLWAETGAAAGASGLADLTMAGALPLRVEDVDPDRRPSGWRP